jgi:glutamine amidotransferase
VDFAQVAGPQDRVALVATQPLTDEAWTAFRPGELRAFVDGVSLT